MGYTEHNIFTTDSLKVDYFRSGEATGKLAFSFTEFGVPSLTGLGYGGKFLLGCGFDLIAIKSIAKDFYQTLPSDIFLRIERFLGDLPERHTRRVVYASSKGGYAAMMFARDLKADAVLALSPLFDISQEWDRRWAAQAAGVGPIRTFDRSLVRPDCHYYIAYDPKNDDRLHYEKFAEFIPREILHPIRVAYAGHPTGPLLNAIGYLKDMIVALRDETDLPELARRIRKNRAAYPDYFLYVAQHCLRRDKITWGRRIIAKAIDLKPLDSEFRYWAAVLEERTGDLVKAIPHVAVAVAVEPDHPYLATTLSRLLYSVGMHGPALRHIETAVSLMPDDPELVEQRAEIQSAMRRETA